ncbi:MAG: GH3 auxin-responsive promoter family protein [Flavobacteriales bacterium Tduv]
MVKSLVNSVSGLFMKQRFNQMKGFIDYPVEAQNLVLLDLIRTSGGSCFGKKYGFREIKSYENFVTRVPLHNYEDLFPFIERMRRGESDVLWPGKVKWFAKSSGTTNTKSKYIPITKVCLDQCHYKAGKDLIALYMRNHPDTKIFHGKNLRLGGSYKPYDCGTFYGDVSSILMENLPFWAERRSTPGKSVILMSEWKSKLEAIVNEVAKQNVMSLFGVPSWMLVLLNRLLETSEKKYLDELWPDLEVFFHGGMSFKPYVEQYKKLLSKEINYYDTYNASEGFFSVQDQKDSKELLLLLDHGIFYEFIPMEEIDNEFPSIVSIEGVELNRNYAMVISTNSGLWRYIIGDTIKFTCLSPYRIVISGRTKHFINAFGEELIVENAEEALSKTCRRTDAIIREYTAGPVYMKENSSGAHEWIIEFEKAPSDIDNFRNTLDDTLQSLNSDYEAKRYKNITLRPPVIRVARKGLFYDWFKSCRKLGGQSKVPRLTNDRKYLDLLLRMNQNAWK